MFFTEAVPWCVPIITAEELWWLQSSTGGVLVVLDPVTWADFQLYRALLRNL